MNFFKPVGNILCKLRLIHMLHVIYRWKYHYNFVINNNNVRSLWRYLKKYPA